MTARQLQASNINNLTHLWKLMGVARYPLDSSRAIYVSTHWPDRIWLDWEYCLKPADIDLLLSRIGRIPDNAILPIWHTPDKPLTDALHNNGFKVVFEQTAMALELDNKTEYLPDDLQLSEVSTAEAARIWADVASRSFGYDVYPPVIEKMIGIPESRLLLGFLNETPVATGLLFDDNSVTGVHMLGVVPSHRRRGIARQVMQGLIGMSRRAGSRYITLQASVMGQTLYETMGFKKQSVITNFGRFTPP